VSDNTLLLTYLLRQLTATLANSVLAWHLHCRLKFSSHKWCHAINPA